MAWARVKQNLVDALEKRVDLAELVRQQRTPARSDSPRRRCRARSRS